MIWNQSNAEKFMSLWKPGISMKKRKKTSERDIVIAIIHEIT
jgi:hypothetical protein